MQTLVIKAEELHTAGQISDPVYGALKAGLQRAEDAVRNQGSKPGETN